jgi:hypothetical protein
MTAQLRGSAIRQAAVAALILVAATLGTATPAAADNCADDGGTFNCGVGYGVIQVRWQGPLKIYLYTENNQAGFLWADETANGWTTKTFYTELHRARWYATASLLNTEQTFQNCGYDD